MALETVQFRSREALVFAIEIFQSHQLMCDYTSTWNLDQIAEGFSTMPSESTLSPQIIHPPTSTLLLLRLPPALLLGIDLLTLTTPSASSFHGIKNLPPGPHFVFVAETPSDSLRTGFWFFVPATSPPTLIVRSWDPDSSSLALCPSDSAEERAQRTHLPAIWDVGLMPYRQSASQEPESESGVWQELTAHITPALLRRLLSEPHDWTMTTSSCAPQDRDDIPGLSLGNARGVNGIGKEPELRTLGIDLKRTWRAGAVGRERTEGAVDRSWALEDLVARMAEEEGNVELKSEGEDESEGESKGEGGGEDEGGSEAEGEREGTRTHRKKGQDSKSPEQEWGSIILGQLETTFLATITLANYSTLQEWKRTLTLVLTCSRALSTRPTFFLSILRLLRAQLLTATQCVDDGSAFPDPSDAESYLKPLLVSFRRRLARTHEDWDLADPPSGNPPLPPEPQRSRSSAKGTTWGAHPSLVSECAILESWLRREYGWELDSGAVLRKGWVRLEDGEMVEVEMDGEGEEGEGGEYGPVVVDLGDGGS